MPAKRVKVCVEGVSTTHRVDNICFVNQDTFGDPRADKEGRTVLYINTNHVDSVEVEYAS